MSDIVQVLRTTFQENAVPAIRDAKTAYMKHKFQFFGLQRPLRVKLASALCNRYTVASEQELIALLRVLWREPEREFHYTALDIAWKYRKLWSEDFLVVCVYLIDNHPWWDTIDTIATKFLGYLAQRHASVKASLAGWIHDKDLWKRRSALLYQLKYKHKTDAELLARLCCLTMHEREFFIRKAIGWALREYSKTNPAWVRAFIERHDAQLSPLSKREAAKYC